MDTEDSDQGLLAQMGLTDLPTALSKATEAKSILWDAGQYTLGRFERPNREFLVVTGLMARAQAFHEGVLLSVEADNPYAAFTLLRAYAENAAAIAYLSDKPTQLSNFIDADAGVAIGRITGYATKYSDGFKEIYRQLSQFAHPAADSVLTSHRLSDNPDGTLKLKWHSAPSFKEEQHALLACAWVIELAIAHGDLIRKLAWVLTDDSKEY